MALPNGSENVASRFAEAVIRQRWAELPPLCSAAARPDHTPESMEAAFGWDQLGPRLRQMYIAMTGEPEEIVPHLDPPERFEVFEVERRDPPAGHDPAVPVGWVVVSFLPSEDSEFDECYDCFLAIVDEAGPRIAGHVIELATE